MQEMSDLGSIPGWKIPWGRAWQSTPVFLPGESHWTEETGGYSPQVTKFWTQLKRLSKNACTHNVAYMKKRNSKYVLNKRLNKPSKKWSQNNNINKNYVVMEMTHSEPHLENWKVQRFWKLMDLYRMCALLCCHFSCIWLFFTSCTVARQAPLSIGFSRQEY